MTIYLLRHVTWNFNTTAALLYKHVMLKSTRKITPTQRKCCLLKTFEKTYCKRLMLYSLFMSE